MTVFRNNHLRELKSFIATTFNFPTIYSSHSFSQDGEDLVLEKIFKNKKSGFYVDVGAHHPFRYSNTQLLYQNSWRGINIEPTPGVKELFDRTRKRDINIQIAIGTKEGISTLYCFEDSALNTISKTRANATIRSNQSKIIDNIQVQTETLENIFKKNIKRKHIDLLNIDVEGNELSVLKSNNWKLYIPIVIVIENLNHNESINRYLKRKGYKMIKRTRLSEIYKQG